MSKTSEAVIIGRQSIFRGKSRQRRVQVLLTAAGWKALKATRVRLARLARVRVNKVSHADTLEYALRGDLDTRIYLGLVVLGDGVVVDPVADASEVQ